MITFAALQNTYHAIEIALFKNACLIESVHISKTDASKDILLNLDMLLQRHQVTLADLEFLAVNQGPGPFTTLRVVIATANGISFASKIPMIGIDALAAFMDEYTNPAYPITVALLNAFNDDLYTAIQSTPHTAPLISCNNSLAFFKELSQKFPESTSALLVMAQNFMNKQYRIYLEIVPTYQNHCHRHALLNTSDALDLNHGSNKKAYLDNFYLSTLNR